MSDESKVREQIAAVGRSLYGRGLSPGSSGNISVRLADGWLLTPTNSCLGELDPSSLSKLDWNGNLISGAKPSKEYFLHLAMYLNRPQSGAIVHLHSSFAAAVSCLEGLDPTSCIPPITPYFVMQENCRSFHIFDRVTSHWLVRLQNWLANMPPFSWRIMDL
jgi:3-dehydro-4-phosphotetronate decarboxylase